MELNEQIKEYVELQKEQEELKAKLDAAKQEIIDAMTSQGLSKFETAQGTATLVAKTNIKYTDELAIVKYCEDNNLTNYITKKVNATALNKELKKGGVLKESLNTYYSENVSQVLTVK